MEYEPKTREDSATLLRPADGLTVPTSSWLHHSRQELVRMANSARALAHHRVSSSRHTESRRQDVLTIRRTSIIDDVYRSVSDCDDDPEKRNEGKKIVEQIVKLKYEIQHDREITYAALPLYSLQCG